MIICFLKETATAETRCAITPDTVKRYVGLGASVLIESGAGNGLYLDAELSEKGATIASRAHCLSEADVVLGIHSLETSDISALKTGAVCVSYMDPFNAPQTIDAFNVAKVTAISVEMIPRTTLAQKMDALSSQASIAGYAAVMLAASELDSVFPMMMTPAGTLSPSKVFVIGAGVAGLQAIATAKRLGARVEAYDTRPVVEEQVQSLGAKFVKIDVGDTGQTQQGYAKALTDDQLEKQRQGMAKHCASADVIITTAQLFGRKAPRIITADMVKGMRSGSIIIDMAAGTGGNVEGSVADAETTINGVRLFGFVNLPGRVARHASQMYASNLFYLVQHFWNAQTKSFMLNFDDEIAKGCVITHQGQLVNDTVIQIIKGK
jgi:NAD(P) transhydrogenase subunit alpha